MSHVRTQIRARVATTTLANLTTSGTRVFQSRQYPLDDAALPGICVYSGKEKKVGGTLTTTTRQLELIVDLVAGGATWEATVDLMDAEVERALFADYASQRYFSGLCIGIEFSISDVKYIEDARIPYGIRRVVYNVTYCTEDGNAETAR